MVICSTKLSANGVGAHARVAQLAEEHALKLKMMEENNVTSNRG